MKKLLITGLAVVMLVVAITGVYAFGPGGNFATGTCMNYTNLTLEQKAKMDQFQKEMLPLRQQMIAKRSELMSLRLQSSPDWVAIENKQKEMAELKTQMQKKAFEAGVTGMQGGCGQCGGPGKGMMKGWMM